MICPFKSKCRITQEFGNDFYYKGKLVYRSMGYPGHQGIDFSGVNPGEKVKLYFPCDGYVTKKIHSDRGYGNYVKIHTILGGKKYEMTFAHLDSISDIYVGKVVTEGELIGVMGSSGLSTAVHLHWDVRQINSRNRIIDTKNGYKGFLQFLNLPRGTYTEDVIENALQSYFGVNIISEKTYIDKWNEWLVKNKIVGKGNFTEDQIRVIIAATRIAKSRRKLSPLPS